MPEGWGLGAALNNIGIVGGCLALVYMFIKDSLVSGKRLRRAEADRDKWERIALDAMRASATAILPAAETVHALVSNLPDPGAERSAENAESGAP